MEEKEERIPMGGEGYCDDSVFWTWYGYCAHEITEAMVA